MHKTLTMTKIKFLLALLYLVPLSLFAQFQDIGGANGGEVLDVVFVNDTIFTLTSASLSYSVNNGSSWSIVHGSNDLPSKLTHVSIDNGIIYLSVNYRNIIFKTENFGQSWTQIMDDSFYSQGAINDFESHNDTLYIYSTSKVYMSTDRGANFNIIDVLTQSFPFILVHNRILHFKDYHYYLTPDRKLVRTRDFINLEELFQLSTNSYYRLFRNENTLFLLDVAGSNKTLYTLENDAIKVYKGNSDLIKLSLNSDRPLLYDGNIVYEKGSDAYYTDGWDKSDYIMLQDNPNSSWITNLIKIHKGVVYYNWGNLFYTQNLANGSRVNITNNMIGNINNSIYKSGSKIISGINPIAYYDVIEQAWSALNNEGRNTYLLNDNLILKYDSKDSIDITTLDGLLFKRSKLPRGAISGNDGIYGINNLIFATKLYDSLYVSNDYGESWHAIDKQSGVGRMSVNYSNNYILVNSGYNTKWYASKDDVNYTLSDPGSGGTYVSVDEAGNIFYKKNELLYKYIKALDSVELIPLPFVINTNYNANGLCFELYKNILFVGGIGEGLFISYDKGENWEPFNDGLASKNVSSIEIDDEYIYIGTYGHIYRRPLDELNALTVAGAVFEDENGNGVKDVNEKGVKNIHVKTTVNNIIVPTNELGQFTFITNDIADNKVEIIAPLYSTATNGPVLIDNNSNPIELGILFDKEVNDVGVKILSPFVFRPGFKTQIMLYLENKSYNNRSVNVDLIIDDKLTFNHSDYAPYQISGNILSYDDILLNGRANKTITINFETDVNANIGEIISLRSNIELKDYVDADLSNNSYELVDTIRGSYDPNDKAVYPGSNLIFDQGLLTQDLLYTIRFQNTGNYPAEFVILRDTLETSLDLESIDVLAYSHVCEWQVKNGRILEVKFPNINLPDSTKSVELSQGYITFKLRVNKNVEIGTSITNNASIYFDYNPPIITKTVITNIVEPSAIVSTEKSGFTIIPNPSTGLFTIKLPRIIGKANLIVTNINGQIIFTKELENSVIEEIDITHQPSGSYNIEVYPVNNLTRIFYERQIVKI